MAMGWGITLLVAAAGERVPSGPVYYIGLAVVLLVVIIATVGFYRTWAEVHEDEEPDSPEEILESFREAHAAGQIDDKELERVSALLSPGDAGAVPHPPRKPVSRRDAKAPVDDTGPSTMADHGPPPR